MTSISTPPSALANTSPTKLEPRLPFRRSSPPRKSTVDSDDEIEVDAALDPSSSFGNNTLRASSSAPAMGHHIPSTSTPARSSSGPTFGYGFGFGTPSGLADPVRRIGMGSVKGKGRLLDGFDMIDASPSIKPKSSAASIWSTGTGSAGSTGTPERSPRKREHGDRFIPQRDDWDSHLSATYNLSTDPRPPTPRRTPIETDAHKEQQNRTFSTALASEMFPHAPFMASSPPNSVSGIGIKRRRSPSPAPSTPSRQRILGFSTPGSTPGSVVSDLGLLDASHPAYSPYAVRRRTHAMLTGPQTTIRTISKTPYKVLDAPELKDDFYLNLVDWSSTNLLGVGLGSCVYLWSAESSKVVKLCDLGNVNPVTSVSWVQKVRVPTLFVTQY